jgi:two-component system sensor histidine kinase KdpD
MESVGRTAGLFWLSALAHDLRSPLTSLATTSELLEADLEALDRKDIRAAVGTIRRGTVWLLELAENLLAAAAINDDRLRVQPTTIALLPVISEVEGVVRPVLAQREQRLRTLIRGEAQPVVADRRRLAQILINLVLNASKYSPPQTTIDIIAWHRGNAVRIAVADRGPGIPRAYRERIFEPFFRVVDGEDGGKTQGDGLGLAIVRSLVEAHGSAPRVECRRGGGTRIWFELKTDSAST